MKFFFNSLMNKMYYTILHTRTTIKWSTIIYHYLEQRRTISIDTIYNLFYVLKRIFNHWIFACILPCRKPSFAVKWSDIRNRHRLWFFHPRYFLARSVLITFVFVFSSLAWTSDSIHTGRSSLLTFWYVISFCRLFF